MNKTAEKFRKMSKGLLDKVETMRIPSSQNPTPKRNREQAAKLIEANKLERAGIAMIALADMHEAGTITPNLATYKTKDQIVSAVSTRTDSSGYYNIYDTNEFHHNTDEAKELQSLLKPKDAAQIQKEKIETLTRNLITCNIEGFFQTPPSVVDRLIELADIQPHHICLEPSAGNGNIADKLPKGCDVIEINNTLRQILTMKGYNIVDHDFMLFHTEKQYDRIVMNPPFERGQDMMHVIAAYDFLKPGGRMVAILGNGYTFRSDKKSVAFREWLADKLEQEIDLPAGTFAGRETVTQTQVPAKIIVLNKK